MKIAVGKAAEGDRDRKRGRADDRAGEDGIRGRH